MLSLLATPAHRTRWNGLVTRIVDAAGFIGLDEAQVIVRGDPYEVHVPGLLHAELVETAHGPEVMVRSDLVPRSLTAITMDAPDDDVVMAVVDAIGSLIRRRDRRYDADRRAQEAELVEMVRGFDLVPSGRGMRNLAVGFRDGTGAVRGTLARIETCADRPDQARFALTLSLAPMAYADALHALHLARTLASRFVTREPLGAFAMAAAEV